MEWETDLDSTNVEDRITGEFMTRLQESDVDFALVDAFEGLVDEEDFGGEETIVEIVEDELIDDEP